MDGVRRFDEVVTELTAEDAREFINDKLVDEEDIYNLTFALKALEHGVERVHIVPYAMDGGLLAELFTHDGVGTMMTMENLESLRQATSDDVSGLIKLLEPLEADGTLVKRPREKLERDISHFTVLEHDRCDLRECRALSVPGGKTRGNGCADGRCGLSGLRRRRAFASPH